MELGPGSILRSNILKHKEMNQELVISSLRRKQSSVNDESYILNAIGSLWTLGVPIDWTSYHENNITRRIPLPSYPFERKSYWVKRPAPADEQSNIVQKHSIAHTGDATDSEGDSCHQYTADSVESSIIRIWKDFLGLEHLHAESDFFQIGGDSLLATRMIAQVRDRFSMSSADIPLKVFMENPTLSALVHEVSSKTKFMQLQRNREALDKTYEVEYGEL